MGREMRYSALVSHQVLSLMLECDIIPSTRRSLRKVPFICIVPILDFLVRRGRRLKCLRHCELTPWAEGTLWVAIASPLHVGQDAHLAVHGRERLGSIWTDALNHADLGSILRACPTIRAISPAGPPSPSRPATANIAPSTAHRAVAPAKASPAAVAYPQSSKISNASMLFNNTAQPT